MGGVVTQISSASGSVMLSVSDIVRRRQCGGVVPANDVGGNQWCQWCLMLVISGSGECGGC